MDMGEIDDMRKRIEDLEKQIQALHDKIDKELKERAKKEEQAKKKK